MLTDPHFPPPSNPFATRYTRPDAGEFLFPAGTDADSLVAQLRRNDWRGQITGPHGSGKSTLVHTLLPKLQAAGRRVEMVALLPQPGRQLGHRSGGSASDPSVEPDSGLPGPFAVSRRADARVLCRRDSVAGWDASTQIVVDGYEQLGWLRRTWLKWHCRRREAGLLVTAHRDVGLPPLWHTETSVELTRQVVARLLGEADAQWVGAGQIDRLFAEQRGNLREVLFALYDLYERRNAGGMQESG